MAVEISRLTCATCDRRLAVCTSCGTRGCPDPTCYDCFAERMGFPHSALWHLRQAATELPPLEIAIPEIDAAQPSFEP